MRPAVEHNPVQSAITRSEACVSYYLKSLTDKLRPVYPKASVSVFFKSDRALYQIDALGNFQGTSARSFGEAEEIVEMFLKTKPMTISEIEQTLGVPTAFPSSAMTRG